MRFIRALLFVPIDGWITSAIRRRVQRTLAAAFALKAFLPSPRLDQCSIYRKVLIREQLFAASLSHDQKEKLLGNSAL